VLTSRSAGLEPLEQGRQMRERRSLGGYFAAWRKELTWICRAGREWSTTRKSMTSDATTF
jgi:hypothetical protein